MSIDRLRSHYGFSRMPFGKDLAPGMLHAHDAHAQAVARIQWCISEQAIGVISGECGAGKTVAARAAVAGLDASRHTVLYLGTPGVGLRGIYGLIVTSLGGSPKAETQSYVTHHLALAGRSDTLFSDDAVGLIHEVSRGLPRQVNNLALSALIAAFAQEKAIVDESSARAAVAEISEQ